MHTNIYFKKHELRMKLLANRYALLENNTWLSCSRKSPNNAMGHTV